MMKYLTVTSYISSPLLLAFVIFLSNPSKYQSIQFFGAMLLGVFGYTWILWQFVLSARPKFIEKYFGLDKMMRFHGIMALVAIGFAVLHKSIMELFFSKNIMTQSGSIALFIFIGISALSLFFLSPGFMKKIPVFKPVFKVIKAIKVFTYERMKIIHNASMAGACLVQIHVLMTSSARESTLLFNLYMAYFFIAAGFYLSHKAIKPWLIKQNHYLVSNVVKESNDIWTVEFKPRDGISFPYRPGQFGYFRMLSKEIPDEEHPFSISSTPTDLSKISITVKGSGDFTQSIKNVHIGDQVQIDGPYGRFSYTDFPDDRAIVFIAGGVGITPILSMVRHMSEQKEKRQILLIWGTRTQSDLIRAEELVQLQEKMINFKWIPVLSGDANWKGEKGYIDFTKLQYLLTKENLTANTTGFYICGPVVLMDLARRYLQQLGIQKQNVHYEQFS